MMSCLEKQQQDLQNQHQNGAQMWDLERLGKTPQMAGHPVVGTGQWWGMPGYMGGMVYNGMMGYNQYAMAMPQYSYGYGAGMQGFLQGKHLSFYKKLVL